MDIRITVDTSDFGLNNADVDAVIQAELERTAYNIERGAKRNCPVDTGNLRRTITTEIGSMEVNVGSNCEYASYVHDGTRYQSAQPFLEEATNANLDDLANRIAEAIEDLLL